MSESEEQRQLASPSVADLAAISKFMTALADLTSTTRVRISSPFTLGLRYSGDVTALRFSWDSDGTVYRATPVTYTVTKGGAL